MTLQIKKKLKNQEKRKIMSEMISTWQKCQIKKNFSAKLEFT